MILILSITWSKKYTCLPQTYVRIIYEHEKHEELLIMFTISDKTISNKTQLKLITDAFGREVSGNSVGDQIANDENKLILLENYVTSK